MKFVFSIIVMGYLLSGCEKTKDNNNRDQELISNDNVLSQVAKNAKNNKLNYLFSIDHSRLAAEAGEVLDASKVAIYSNSSVNSQLLHQNIRVGLDLPYRVQAFHHKGQSKTVYTKSDFLINRHDLVDSKALNTFDSDLKNLLQGINNVSSVSSGSMGKNYGIVELLSSLDFENTITALKKTIMAEGDTVWFYTLDYQKEALKYDITLPQVKLLVFGAPAPGAKAMREYPSIGLDAFGQKVLVYTEIDESDGTTIIKVIYNDIPALAELHYNDSALAHKVIKFRLNKTLSSAIEQ
jgi:uncharacterized protein (DUF302 family)